MMGGKDRQVANLDVADLVFFGPRRDRFGNGPNTVSESTVSNTELSEFLALTEFRGENSVSSSQTIIFCAKANSPSFSQNSPSLP